MYRFFIAAILCVLVLTPVCAGVQVNPIGEQDAKAWLNYTVPLPKEIKINGETLVPRGNVSLELKYNISYPVYSQIFDEFVQTCGNSNKTSEFMVIINVGGEQAESLKKLPNSSQAYTISSEDGKSVTISALDYHGAYYGWITLRQLIAGRSSSENLKIPVLTVKDWPDMEKRGLWGTDSFLCLEWLAGRKMNHEEQINARGMNPDGTFYAATREFQKNLDTDCAKYAIDYAPVVLHLEQGDKTEIFKRYPAVKAKNATYEGTLCYSEPMTVDMISQWIYELAKNSPTTEVDVWLSENLAGKSGCQCEKCKENPYALNEARAVLKAWDKAKQRLGRYITVYLLTSEATESANEKIFAELPKDVRIWYYHSLLSYNTSRLPMLRPYIEAAAKNGLWIGVCPNVDAWTHSGQPFTGAKFIKYRMDEFQNKGLKGLLGYATPRVYYNAFNVEAAAEWGWNLNGRSTKDFAYSYAVRNGYKDPEKFAEWSETLGPVGWDVYGSNWPHGQLRKRPESVLTAVKNGTLPPLGFVLYDCFPAIFANFTSEEQLYNDAASMDKAIKLAKEIGRPEVMYETLVIDGYIRSLKALYELKKLAPNGGYFAAADKYAAQQQFHEFFSSLNQSAEYLPKWEECIKFERDKDNQFTNRPAENAKRLIEGVKKEAAEMGVEL